MIQPKLRSLVALACSALLISGISCAVLPDTALAEPSAKQQELEAKAKDARNKLDSLNIEAETAAQNLLDIQDEIEALKGQISETQEQVDVTQAELTETQVLLGKRVAATYKAGNSSILEVLLGSENFEDFISRVHYVSSIQDADAQVIAQARDLREELTQQQSVLESQLEHQQELEVSAKAKKDDFDAAVSQQKSLVASLDDELEAEIQRQREAEEAARRAAYEAGQHMTSNVVANNGGGSNDSDGGSNNNGGGSNGGGGYSAPSRPANGNGGGVARSNVVETARQFIGVPYVWGGTTPNGFDCSGLCQYVYRLHGISIPRTSRSQAADVYNKGHWRNSTADLVPGDLVFFSSGGISSVYHVGIYIGGGNMIHAPQPGQSVTVAPVFRGFIGGGSV